MRLAELVQVSRRVADTPRRSEKVALLSDLLSRLPGPEIEIAPDGDEARYPRE